MITERLPFDPAWDPLDPGRSCYSCGTLPVDRFTDGSPRYDCGPHEPVKGPPGWQAPPHPESRITLAGPALAIVERHTQNVMAHARAIQARDNWAIGRESDHDLKFRGYCAELAAALLTGLQWWPGLLGRGGHKPQDIGRRTEVRNTPIAHGKLAFKKGDRIEHVFLLMIGAPPTFRAAGWLEGHELITFPRLGPPRVPFGGYFAGQGGLRPLPLPADA